MRTVYMRRPHLQKLGHKSSTLGLHSVGQKSFDICSPNCLSEVILFFYAICEVGALGRGCS